MPLMFPPPRLSRRPNVYTEAERRHRPRQIDPYRAPGGLAGLAGAAAGPTGITAVDAFISDANSKADRLVIATEIGTVCSLIGAVAGLIVLFRGRR